MPIRVRLTLLFAIATLVLFGVTGLLFLRSFRHGLETSLDPGLHTQATTLATELTAGNAAVPVELRGASSVLRTHDVVAQFLDPRAHVLDATDEAGATPVVGRAAVARAAGGSVASDVRVGREREPYRVVVQRVSANDARFVVVGTSLEPTDDAVDRVRTALLAGGALAVAVAAAGAWFLASAALRPVERMRREAADLSASDGDARLRVPQTRDELAKLGATMNDLLGRMQHALRRQRAFVADAGHELRTPLAVLRAELELADRPNRTPDELRASVRHAAQETERVQAIAEQLLLLARVDEPAATAPAAVELTPVAALLRAAVDAFGARAAAREVALELQADAEVLVPAEPVLLRQAVDNLLDNALRYSPPHTAVTVRLRADDTRVSVDVLDEGPGFPPEFLPHAFERFRRADDARSRADGGTGLGLAIVRAVAVAHGGTATLANRPTGGAVATITIPNPEM